MKKSSDLYLSAREASAELAVSPATLYAYVSRGLIRSEPSPDSRSHRYRAEDVRGLKERRGPPPRPPGPPRFRVGFAGVGLAVAALPPRGPHSPPRPSPRPPRQQPPGATRTPPFGR